MDAFVFPSGRPRLRGMAVGCDLGLLTPWDQVLEFRLGFDVPFCLFKVACDMRVLEMIRSCIQGPVSRITYLK